MYITYEALITKMESELKKAREAKDHEQMRGHLFAVKALAELTLDTGGGVRKEQPQVKVHGNNEFISKELSPSKEPYHEDIDDGDSIFDF